MQINSYAKINIFLYIGPERTDGFHEVFSLFAPIGFSDILEIEPNGVDSCRIEMDFDPAFSEEQFKALDIPIEQNLVYKAWSLFPREQRTGLDIKLTKRIPPGGGLGGGSSNAAAVLNYLNRTADTPLPQADLLELAARLGSDVPFFLTGQAGIASGRGEIIEPYTIDRGYVVLLVIPDFTISTKWAYTNVKIDLTPQKKQNILYKLCSCGLNRSFKDLDNSFRELLENEHDFYRETRAAMLDAGALMSIPSGSGSTMFGLFDNKTRAEAAMKRLRSGRLILTELGQTEQ